MDFPVRSSFLTAEDQPRGPRKGQAAPGFSQLFGDRFQFGDAIIPADVALNF